MSRVVELVGAPGTGKSAVSAGLSTVPGVDLLKDHRAGDLPALVWSALTAVRPLTSRPPEGVSRTRWIAWLGRAGAAPHCVRRRLAAGARTVVLDQGPVYTLGRMVGPSGTDPAVTRWHRARLADCRRLLDVVVLLDGDTDVLAERIRTRSKAHPAGALPPVGTRAYVHRERVASRRIVDLVASTGVVVIELDAGMPLAKNVALVQSLIGADAPPVDQPGGPA